MHRYIYINYAYQNWLLMTEKLGTGLFMDSRGKTMLNENKMQLEVYQYAKHIKNLTNANLLLHKSWS